MKIVSIVVSKKCFDFEKEFQLSSTNQIHVSQTQNLIFFFELVNTKTMLYLPSMFLVNKIKILYVLCLSLFLKNKANIVRIQLHKSHNTVC